MLTRLRAFFGALLRRRRMESEMDAELRFHMEAYVEDLVRSGIPRPEAQHRAGIEFGGVTCTKEDCRQSLGLRLIDEPRQDLRYAARSMRRNPGFALTAICTLALGLGTLATAFSVFNAFALRPFPVRDGRSLYWFEWQARDSNHAPTTWREFTDLRAQQTAFSDVLAYQPALAPLMGRQAWVNEVSGNYFTMLGGLTCMGRPILESDDAPSSPAVAVVAYDMWKSRLGADPSAVGRTLYVRGQPVEIVGVACPEFNGLSRSPVAAWVSQALSATLANKGPYGPQEDAWTLVGRLKPGMGPEGARAALLAYGRDVSADWKDVDTPERVQLEQRWLYWAQGVHIGGFQRIFVVFGLILLIACANVSNMMLARCLARQREIGVRISLGAGRGRMIRQLLTESLLLALPAALAAFAVAHVTIKAAVWLAPNVFSIGPTDLTPDWRVMAFLLAAGACSTLMFGLAPALQATRSSLVQANRGEFANGYRPALLRNALVAIQVTLCAFLLILASVALLQERVVASQGAGMDVHNVFSVRLPWKFQAPVAARLRSDPRVVSVGAYSFGGLSYVDDAARSGRRIYVPNSMVSPEYFGILRAPILRGRNFSEADAGADVAILSEAAARRLCPRQDALGRTLTFSGLAQATVVIGIVRDAVYNGYIEVEHGRLNTAYAFLPIDPKLSAPSLLVRTRGDAGPARRAIETEVDRLTLGEAGEAVPMEQMQAGWQSIHRVLLGITGFLGLQALLLTVAGIYGVLSHLVSQRKQEIGIRIALGADGGAVARMVLRQSAWLAAAGAAIGAVLALGAARVMANNAMAMIAFDPAGYAVGMLVVIAAAMAASWVPARRAVRINPAVMLRCD
jgi:predicted permease